MRGKFTYTKIAFLGLLFLLVPVFSKGQVASVGIASTSKMASMSLGEGIAQRNPMLLELVTKAGLMPRLSAHESFTFFAPAEKALAQYANATPEELKAFLGNHIVASSLTSADLKDGTDIKNINGGTLRIYRKNGNVLVDGVRITESDQLHTNGVLHQLNGALPANTPK